MATEKVRENRVRRRLERWGYRLSKSRGALSLDNQGQYNVYDVRMGLSVIGQGKYESTLEDIEEWLAENGEPDATDDRPLLHPVQTGTRALREYERSHRRVVELLAGEPMPVPRPENAIGPHRVRLPGATEEAIRLEAEAITRLGTATGWYRGDPAVRSEMRVRFAEGCRYLTIQLLEYASSLSFQHYDLPKELDALFVQAPLERGED